MMEHIRESDYSQCGCKQYIFLNNLFLSLSKLLQFNIKPSKAVENKRR